MPIPTLADVAQQIERDEVFNALSADPDFIRISQIMVATGSPAGALEHLLELIAVARACHAAADVRRHYGVDEGVWFDLGQELLDRCVNALADEAGWDVLASAGRLQ